MSATVFFQSMLSKFAAEGVSIYWYSVDDWRGSDTHQDQSWIRNNLWLRRLVRSSRGNDPRATTTVHAVRHPHVGAPRTLAEQVTPDALARARLCSF